MSTRQHANLKLAVTSSLQRKDAIEREEAPELSIDEIMAGLKQELRSISVPILGRVYYYYPLGGDELSGFSEKIAPDGTTSWGDLVQTVIAFSRDSKGAPKFTQDHLPFLLKAPTDVITKLANTFVSSHRFTVASGEKK